MKNIIPKQFWKSVNMKYKMENLINDDLDSSSSDESNNECDSESDSQPNNESND